MIMEPRFHEVRDKVSSHQVEAVLRKFSPGSADVGGACLAETLIITDEPQAAREMLAAGGYVVILYHEKKQASGISLRQVRGGGCVYAGIPVL